jgi:hypothetical protein
MCQNNPDAHLYRRTIQTFEEKTGPFTSFDKVPTPEAVIIASMVSTECRLLARHSDLNGTVTTVYGDDDFVVLLDEFPNGQTAIGIGAQSQDSYGRALILVGAIEHDPGSLVSEDSSTDDPA